MLPTPHLISLTLLLFSIRFVRFDGKMSAKRRQEAIARFSVPIEEASPPIARRTRNTGSVIDVENYANGNDSDGDFVMNGDNDNLDDELSASQRRSKAKGKGKAQDEFSYELSDENPRVMLLSLKAVSRTFDVWE